MSRQLPDALDIHHADALRVLQERYGAHTRTRTSRTTHAGGNTLPHVPTEIRTTAGMDPGQPLQGVPTNPGTGANAWWSVESQAARVSEADRRPLPCLQQVQAGSLSQEKKIAQDHVKGSRNHAIERADIAHDLELELGPRTGKAC